MRKKLKECGGFTMVEMLCVVVILVLLCLLVNSGLSLAMRSYRDITAESETQLLLSDLSNALADKLRYAVVTGNYADDGTFVPEKCSVGEVIVDDDNMVKMKTKFQNADGSIEEEKNPLLPTGVYGSKYPNVMSGSSRRYAVETAEVTPDYTGTTPVFTVVLKVKDTLGNVSAETELIVRCLNPIKEEGE